MAEKIPIRITEKAQAQVLHIMQHKGIPENYALRVMVQGGGGCGGALFRLGFDSPKPEDKRYQIGDVPVLLDKRHFLFLVGIELDFEEREHEQGFVFNKLSPEEMA